MIFAVKTTQALHLLVVPRILNQALRKDQIAKRKARHKQLPKPMVFMVVRLASRVRFFILRLSLGIA